MNKILTSEIVCTGQMVTSYGRGNEQTVKLKKVYSHMFHASGTESMTIRAIL